MRIYEVELLVSGPITIRRPISFDTDKELHLGDIFRSDISTKKHAQGIVVTSTVYTIDQDRAHKVALLFVGKMLDILAIKTNSPLNVSLNEYRQLTDKNIVKTLIDEQELRSCFELSRQLNLHEGKILRALNWYRKGLYTDDPFDKFLAFWNSINVVAAGYHNQNPRTSLGIVNQIWDCFSTLWSNDCNNWEFINGDTRWINDNNDIRNDIAHGSIAVEINYVENVITRLKTVQKVAYKFLTEWATRLNRPII
jgi:hypothetical protein